MHYEYFGKIWILNHPKWFDKQSFLSCVDVFGPKKIIYVSEQESSIFLLHFYRIGKSIFNLNCIYQLLVDNLKADKHELEWLLHEKPKNI